MIPVSRVVQRDQDVAVLRRRVRPRGFPTEISREGDKIRKVHQCVAVQIESRVVRAITLLRPEICREQDKVGKSDRAVAVEVG